jgi:hypothetical protein
MDWPPEPSAEPFINTSKLFLGLDYYDETFTQGTDSRLFNAGFLNNGQQKCSITSKIVPSGTSIVIISCIPSHSDEFNFNSNVGVCRLLVL